MFGKFTVRCLWKNMQISLFLFLPLTFSLLLSFLHCISFITVGSTRREWECNSCDLRWSASACSSEFETYESIQWKWSKCKICKRHNLGYVSNVKMKWEQQNNIHSGAKCNFIPVRRASLLIGGLPIEAINLNRMIFKHIDILAQVVLCALSIYSIDQ